MSDLTIESLQKAINEIGQTDNRIVGYYINPTDIRTLKCYAILEPYDNWMLFSGFMIIESKYVEIGHPMPFDKNGKIIIPGPFAATRPATGSPLIGFIDGYWAVK